MVVLLLPAMAATAAEIETLTVVRDGEMVDVDASMVINAPRAFVYQALSDYDEFADLTNAYVESRYIEPAADGAPRIYTEVEGCMWFFCRSVRRYARLDLEPGEKIVATVEPEDSDVEYGREEWALDDLGSTTRVNYQHDMQPKFWLPPGLGVWAIRRKLGSTSLEAATRIEELALEMEEATAEPIAAGAAE